MPFYNNYFNKGVQNITVRSTLSDYVVEITIQFKDTKISSR